MELKKIPLTAPVKEVSHFTVNPASPYTQNSSLTSNGLVNQIPTKNQIRKQNALLAAVVLLVSLAGIGMGFMISRVIKQDSKANIASTPSSQIVESQVAGAQTESMFSDSAEGVLITAGDSAEGTHMLDRGSSSDKNVYLLSTVLDLDSFIGKRVQVWGNSVASVDVEWLMDVGRVKVLE